MKVTDYLGRIVEYAFPPNKIISLAPAITNTLYALNLGNEIVGRTRFCIHPKEKVQLAVNIGGTKDLKIERIHELNPDLIIAEKEENTKEMVEQLEQFYPVYVFEVQTIEDSLKMMTDLGHILNRKNEGNTLVRQISLSFMNLPNKNGRKVAYLIWENPYMVVGKHTYIQSVLQKLGFTNPFIHFPGRYPAVTIDDLKQAELDYLFLATEPYPFREQHLAKMKEIVPNAEPIIMDGEMFWYGVNMLEAVSYFQKRLNQFN